MEIDRGEGFGGVIIFLKRSMTRGKRFDSLQRAPPTKKDFFKFPNGRIFQCSQLTVPSWLFSLHPTLTVAPGDSVWLLGEVLPGNRVSRANRSSKVELMQMIPKINLRPLIS